MLDADLFIRPAIAGFLLGLGFIFSIGPQSLQLIHSGAFKDNPTTVATTGYLSEIIIVCVGLAGLSASLQSAPTLGTGLRALGIAFLVWYGMSALLRRGQGAIFAHGDGRSRSRGQAIAAMLSVTWLNPLVYLEIMLLVGVMSSGFPPIARWWFGLGFLCASAIRFYGWCLAGRLLRPWLTVPRRRTQLALLSGCILLGSAVLLAEQVLRELT